jgi:membrane protein
MFTLGKFLIGFYLGHSMITTVYGAAGSFVVILLWVYFSSQLVFFGAEFTHAYARHHMPVPVHKHVEVSEAVPAYKSTSRGTPIGRAAATQE